MRILCLFYIVKLENITNSRIRIKQTSLFELKSRLTIILILIYNIYLIKNI